MSPIAWSSRELVNQYQYLSSGHFFDRDTMRFFNSRVTENYRRLDDNTAVFITTERAPHDSKRRATIRVARLVEYVRESDGRHCQKITIDTFGEFNAKSLDQAKRQLGRITLSELSTNAKE